MRKSASDRSPGPISVQLTGAATGKSGRASERVSALRSSRDAGTGVAWGWFPTERCFLVMDRASHYRDLAHHARQLAEATWQDNLEEILCHLA